MLAQVKQSKINLMNRPLSIAVLSLLWCSISFSDNYKLFSTDEYISKKDANIIFEMNRSEWNKIVTDLSKDMFSKSLGTEDIGLQWWEVLQPGITKMIHAGYDPSFEEKPLTISFWMIFEDNTIFKKEDFDKFYKNTKSYWLPEYKIVGRYKNDGGINQNETEAIFVISKNK